MIMLELANLELIYLLMHLAIEPMIRAGTLTKGIWIEIHAGFLIYRRLESPPGSMNRIEWIDGKCWPILASGS